MEPNQSTEVKELQKTISELENKIMLNEMSSKPVKWFGRFIIFGPNLDSSIKNVLNEFDEKGIPNKKSILIFVWAFWRQVVRINMLIFIVGIIPLILLVFQTIYLNKQNSLFEEQNKLIVQQSNFLKEQVDFMDTQTKILTEDLNQRKQSIVSDSISNSELMREEEIRTKNKNITELDQIFAELDESLAREENINNILTKSIIKKLTNYTQNLKPYRILSKYCPEKGALLSGLIEREISNNDIAEILNNGDFTFSDFEGIELKNCDIRNVNFKGSNFKDAVLAENKFFYVNFRSCDFYNSSLWGSFVDNCDFTKSSLFNSKIRNVEIIECNFTEVDLGNITTNENSKFIKSIFDFALIIKNEQSNSLLNIINREPKYDYSFDNEEQFRKNGYNYYVIRRE